MGASEGRLPHRDSFVGDVANAMMALGFFGHMLEAYGFAADDGSGWRAQRFATPDEAAACAYAAARSGARTTSVRRATLRTYDEGAEPDAELGAKLAQVIAAAIAAEFNEPAPELALEQGGAVPDEFAWTMQKGLFGFTHDTNGVKESYANIYFPTVLENWMRALHAGDDVTDIACQ